jgi:hypothetical protein
VPVLLTRKPAERVADFKLPRTLAHLCVRRGRILHLLAIDHATVDDNYELVG